jgi:antitoxin component of RelBE/YafQ-DinJ toxin-antitoxin module
MGIKTFNIDDGVYQKFSGYCKAHGISMSKQVDLFMRSQIEEDPQAKEEYLQRLERIRKGKFIKVTNFAEDFGL